MVFNGVILQFSFSLLSLSYFVTNVSCTSSGIYRGLPSFSVLQKNLCKIRVLENLVEITSKIMNFCVIYVMEF